MHTPKIRPDCLQVPRNKCWTAGAMPLPKPTGCVRPGHGPRPELQFGPRPGPLVPTVLLSLIVLLVLPRNNNYDLSFVFRSFSGRAWPRDPLQRVRLEKWCRTHPKLAPETNQKAISWPCPGFRFLCLFVCHGFTKVLIRFY